MNYLFLEIKVKLIYEIIRYPLTQQQPYIFAGESESDSDDRRFNDDDKMSISILQ